MRILYAAYRHDPRDPDLASGSDYHYYNAILNGANEIDLLGPFKHEAPIALERLLRRVYSRVTHLRYLKFPLSTTWHLSQALNRRVEETRPDLVFTIFPLFLTFYRGDVPCVYRLDTSLEGWQQNYPEFGKLASRIQRWQERESFRRVTHFITQSEWSKSVLVNTFGIEPNQIEVFPNPAALPEHSVPPMLDVRVLKNLDRPLELLLVGKGFKRKGVGTAIEIVNLLNEQGIDARLKVCSTPGEDSERIKFVGPYKKSVPEELKQYTDLYKKAHFLLHPALFEAAGITPSEAAAFGTPTITNDTGGLATTVKHNKSGVVLPKGSPAEAYAQTILELIQQPDRYYSLCDSTRRRYEEELNWNVAGKRVAAIVREVIEHNNQRNVAITSNSAANNAR